MSDGSGAETVRTIAKRIDVSDMTGMIRRDGSAESLTGTGPA